MIISLKCNPEEFFSFNVNVSSSLKFLALRSALRHLDTQRALEEHSSTQTVKALRPSSA